MWELILNFMSTTLTAYFSGCSGIQLGLPESVPPQYNALKDCCPEVLNTRLRVLYHFSDLMYKSWRLLNLDPRSQVRQSHTHKHTHTHIHENHSICCWCFTGKNCTLTPCQESFLSSDEFVSGVPCYGSCFYLQTNRSVSVDIRAEVFSDHVTVWLVSR